MEEEKRYFYQPDMTTTIIDWSWTLIVLVIGLIIAFEITHFNWITAVFIIAFLLLAGLEIFSRTVTVTPTKMVFSRVMSHNFLSIPLKDIRQPLFTKHTLSITVNGEVMTFTFTQRSLQSIKHFLKHAGVLEEQ